MAKLIRERELSSVEVTGASLAAATRLDTELNCLIAINGDEALAAAEVADQEIASGNYRGPLHGVPLAHKDMFYDQGKPSTGGSKIRNAFVADSTSSVIERLRRAGAVSIGRLGMSEFAAWPTGHNDHYGTPRNPWSTPHITGGSSSGSACAVAARIIYGSMGSDTGGSIRVPAAICGVVGLKPTHGRVSRYGALPRVWSLDAVGPIARTAEDAALLMNCVAGHDPRDPSSSQIPVNDFSPARNAGIAGLNIGVPTNRLYSDTDPETLANLEEALKVLKSLGAVVHRIAMPEPSRLYALADVIGKVEAATLHAQWIMERP
ncbi:MAG: amidase, partial [Terriglobia bacterium]